MQNNSLIVFPGWSYNQAQETLWEQNCKTISHTKQVQLFQDTYNLDEFEDFNGILVTWSMGTWSGLKLLQTLNSFKPKAWIALAPFTDFCTQENQYQKQVDLLLASFEKDPFKTIQLFRRKNNQDKTEEEFYQEDLQSFQASLQYLKGPCPYSSKFEQPLLTLHGKKDRLITEKMSKDFSSSFTHSTHLELEDHHHHLLYPTSEVVTKHCLSFIKKVSDAS